MRKLNLLALLAVFCFSLNAQQEAQYTQFMFNKLAINPGYAGSGTIAYFSGIHRSQWVGLEGAPVSQSLNFHIPLLNRRVGFGVSAQHDKVGPTNSWSYRLMYAYRIKMKKGELGIGLQGLIRSYQVDWSMATTVHSGDGVVPEGESRRMLPNFGVGLYYQTKSWYLGVSVPAILSGDLSFADGTNLNSDYSSESQHFYAMGGLILNLSSKIKVKPALLLKYTNNAPAALDIHTSLIFIDKFWIGLTYRPGGELNDGVGESLDFLLQYQLTDKIRLGLAYDYSLTRLRSYHSGSYELMLEYTFKKDLEGLTNPRYF